MKAPVGLLSGRAVCASRWRGFALTSSAERSKRIFTRGAVVENAVYRCAPFCEKAILENPQIFQNCKYKNIFSAEDGQSATEAIPNRPAPKALYFITLANSAARAAFTERTALASGLMAVRS